ncbi:hypothetical protein [Pseudogemmobacter bohemicus]|uniref:hypothetical protein n=1 Tax=Pseudogemmobacter bohemicus TaxID=2250708 RepID=UPI000DD3A184|nr:hypothetical protein [Pseudogemmobacter bohemicus]
MLVSQVAEVAGEQRETIRTREKLGVYGFERAGGWKRYTDFETLVIAVHAALKRAVKDDDLAQIGCALAGKAIMDEWIKDEEGTPYFDEETFKRERFLFFWRDDAGEWTGEIAATVGEIEAMVNGRIVESYSETPIFTTVNLATILKKALIRMLEVQIKAEMAAKDRLPLPNPAASTEGT